MRNNFRLGLVAEIREEEDGFAIKDCWDRFFDYISKDVETTVFDWKDVSDGKISRYGTGFSGNREFVNSGSLELRSSCDTLFVKQLGGIADRGEDFLRFLDDLENFDGRVINPANTMRNNLSKGYLLDLQSRGIPVIPSKRIEAGSYLENIGFLDGVSDYVIKPEVLGEWGRGVRRISSFKDDKEFQEYLSNNSPAILQPFLKEIMEEGENSLIYFGKELSHAVRKKNGNFKINYEGGGFDEAKKFYEVNTPSSEELRISEDVLSSWDDELGYSRIDFIYNDGKPLVSEVEMVNPSLYNSLVDIDDELFPRLRGFLLNEN